MLAAILGAGVMGRTLLAGLQSAGGWDLRASTHRQSTASKVADQFKLPVEADNCAIAQDADLVVLCLKPKNVLKVAAEIAPILPPNCPVISIAAGVRLADLAEALPAGQPLLRAMPNTPCQAGAGLSSTSFTLAYVGSADAAGNMSYSTWVPPSAAGLVFVQAIDASTDGTSNVVGL